MSDVTPSGAKRALCEFLFANRLTFTTLTAKTVSFEDLARASRVFVKIHGHESWSAETWYKVNVFAKEHGFIISNQ